MMRTYKPISTVSFNSEEFLKVKLDLLVSEQVILRYAFIKHFGEEGKDHFHVYVEPNGVIDTDSEYWRGVLVEPVAENEPLNCLPWRKSNFADWALYSAHDEHYLKAKQMKKKFVNYSISAFVSNDNWFASDFNALDTQRFLSPMERMLRCYLDGMSPLEALIELRIPYGCMHSFLKGWDLIKQMEDNHDYS